MFEDNSETDKVFENMVSGTRLKLSEYTILKKINKMLKLSKLRINFLTIYNVAMTPWVYLIASSKPTYFFDTNEISFKRPAQLNGQANILSKIKCSA